jgi:hypothetical protein
MIPKKEKIYEKALQMWYEDQYRQGFQPTTNPENYELLSNGYFSSARSQIMQDTHKAKIESEFIDYPNEFSVDVAEALISGIYISGSTGTGKSDIGMYVSDQLMKEGITVITFDSSQDWILRSSIPQYQTLTTTYITTIPQTSIIFDISRLSVLDRQRLIESFSEQLYRQQASSSLRREYFLMFEEASSYFKEGFMRSKRLANTSMLLSEGRNYGVRFGLITQFSALIDKTAMRYMRQRYFGFTSEPRDVEYITMFFPKNKKQEMAETLRNLRSGEFVYMNSEGFSKIQIEPYVSSTKTRPEKVQLQNIEPIMLKPKQNNMQALASLIVSLLWFVVVLLMLSQGR